MLSTRQALNDFLVDLTPRALALEGTWGRGKTHLWKAVYSQFVRTCGPNRRQPYSYVSLFGVETLSELKAAIFLNQQYDDGERRTSNWKRLRNGTLRLLSPITADSDVRHIKAVDGFYKAWISSQIKDCLICLDDLERRGAKMRLLDLLGFVSQLCEDRNCRVVVIVNDQSLRAEDTSDWLQQREKVFHSELRFSPSAKDCAEIVFSGEQSIELLAIAKDAIIELGCTNIRTIIRLKAFLEHLERVVPAADLSSEVQQSVSRSLALLAYCHLSVSDGAPSIDYVLNHRPHSHLFTDEKHDHRSEHERAWDKALDAYGVEISPEDDAPLLELVCEGSTDRSRLAALLAGRATFAERQEKIQRYRSVWNLWHYSFRNARNEIIEGLENHFPPAARYIEGHNVDGTARLLRELGASSLADRLIHYWVDIQAKEDVKGLDPEKMSRFEPIKDELLLSLAQEAFKVSRPYMALQDAFTVIWQDAEGQDDAMLSIAAAKAADITTLLLEGSGDEGVAFVSRCLRLDGVSEYQAAVAKVKEALRSIARQSDFQNARMRARYPEVFV